MEDGLDILIAQLQTLKGAAFWQHLVAITKRKEFKEIEKNIFSATSPNNPDYEQQIDAARKAVYFGYIVYMLPNPINTKSADYIFVRKGIHKLYEMKTISGQNSVGNRINEALKQSNRLLLNMKTRYNPRKLGKEIIRCFESNRECKEVMVFYNRQSLTITRQVALRKGFGAEFCRQYGK